MLLKRFKKFLSCYYNASKNHAKKFFFLIIRKEPLRRQNSKEKSLNKTLGAYNTFLDYENKEELEKNKKTRITLLN